MCTTSSLLVKIYFDTYCSDDMFLAGVVALELKLLLLKSHSSVLKLNVFGGGLGSPNAIQRAIDSPKAKPVRAP